MVRKPLEPYNPNAKRSRLPVASIVMPYKNSSQIVIGDRSSNYKKHFKSTNQMKTVKAEYNLKTANTGIIASNAIWVHG